MNILIQYLSKLYRTSRNKPLYSLITLVGFTIGITASLLIYFWIIDELSFDRFHNDSNRIYRVLTLKNTGKEIKKSPATVIPLANALKRDFPQISEACFIKYEMMMPLQLGEKKIEVKPAYTNHDFFKIFSGFTFIEGNREVALSQADAVVITEEIAFKLFGDQPALGKTLSSEKYSEIQNYTVGGVVRIPKQTHLDFGMIALMENFSSAYSNFTNNRNRGEWTSVYLELGKKTRLDDSVLDQLSNLMMKYSDSNSKLLFQPIEDIHLFSDYNYRFDNNIGEIKYIWIFAGLAVLIMAMASLNFVALTTARSSERATEIGLWKTVGSTKWQMESRILILKIIYHKNINLKIAWQK